jgi:hypothetical protein
MKHDSEETMNDKKIIEVAILASKKYNCDVEIITNDVGFSARLKSDEHIHALFIDDYMARKQPFVDFGTLKKINEYYANSYDDIEEQLGIKLPEKEDDFNAYLSDGNTLIISTVRSNKPLEQKKKKPGQSPRLFLILLACGLAHCIAVYLGFESSPQIHPESARPRFEACRQWIRRTLSRCRS